MKSHTEYLAFEPENARDGAHHRHGGPNCAEERRERWAVLLSRRCTLRLPST